MPRDRAVRPVRGLNLRGMNTILLVTVMPGEGFEPPTFGLQNRCTTTVLTRR